MTEARIMIDFDPEYDILYVGFKDRVPSFGKDVSKGITEFFSIKDKTITGVEVWDYKKRVENNELFSSSLPFSNYLNSEKTHKLVLK